MPKKLNSYWLIVSFINAQLLCQFKHDLTHKIRDYLFLTFFAFLACYVNSFFRSLIHRIRDKRFFSIKRDKTLFKRQLFEQKIKKKCFLPFKYIFLNIGCFEKKTSFSSPLNYANWKSNDFFKFLFFIFKEF